MPAILRKEIAANLCMHTQQEAKRTKMILSVSRRTDIPNYYSPWFLNRVKEGFLYVRNPMNVRQISRIDLSPQVVDCMVFWTKNPANMLDRLDELKEYSYYFQFTLTGYGKDIEPNLPDKRQELLETFRKLSEKIGKDKVIWRYDPILINERYTVEYHEKAFEEIADSLKNHTEKVIISFLDFYTKIQENRKRFHMQDLNQEQMFSIARSLAQIAQKNHLTIETCAENIDLQAIGIAHGSCIDKQLIEKILGCRLSLAKDRNQRGACGCYESIDVGAYHTCPNGCKYCYANFSEKAVKESLALYDVNGPLLCSTLGAGDKITERNMHSCMERQLSLFH